MIRRKGAKMAYQSQIELFSKLNSVNPSTPKSAPRIAYTVTMPSANAELKTNARRHAYFLPPDA